MAEIMSKNGEAVVTRKNEENATKSKHGLYRALLQNMVIGVTNGYEKSLIVNGVGWKVNMQGEKLILNVGFSHPVEFSPVAGIKLACPSQGSCRPGSSIYQVPQKARTLPWLRYPL